MAFNGPNRELGRDEHLTDADDNDMVYCVRCGTIYVWAHGRDCPACTLAELIESVGDRVEALVREQRRERDSE